jgi:hypothetical protein
MIVGNRVSHQLAIAGFNTLLSTKVGLTRSKRYRALFKAVLQMNEEFEKYNSARHCPQPVALQSEQVAGKLGQF